MGKTAIGSILFIATFLSDGYGCQARLLPHSVQDKNVEGTLDRLVHAQDLNTEYVDDGAGDASVVNDNPIVAIRDIIALGPKAIPALIAHLDDKRPTAARYKGSSVPIGFVALDLLTQIVQDNKELFVGGEKHCEFDGMGACVRSKYYAKPEVFLGADSTSLARIQTLKRSWTSARRQGFVKFARPAWIK